MILVRVHGDETMIVHRHEGTVFKPILALIGALFLLVVPAAAMAQTATYNVNGTFTAPATGSFSGSYVVNTGSNTIVSANIQVTAGLASNGVTAMTAETYVFAGHEASDIFTLATSTPATGLRGGYLVVTGTKAAPTAVPDFYDAVCFNPVCTSFNLPDRRGSGTVALAPAPVPTMSELALILFGTLLAGGAALYIRRRRLTA